MKKKTIISVSVSVLALLALSCGGSADEDQTEGPGSTGSSTTTGTSGVSGSVAADEEDGSLARPYTARAAKGSSLALFTAPAQPPVHGRIELDAKIRDSSGSLRDGLVLDVKAWMPSHGHGATGKPTVTFAGDGTGTYHISGWALPMAGVWQIRIAMTDAATGFADEATATVDVQ